MHSVIRTAIGLLAVLCPVLPLYALIYSTTHNPTMAIKNNINYLIKKTCNRSSCEGSEALILNGTLEHVLPSNNEPVDVQVTDSILAKNLYKYIDKLPQQHKDILNFTLINNGSLKEYSKNNNINYPTTVNIKNRAINQLRKEILT